MGEKLYEAHCELCHGSRAAGGVKDLRRMTNDTRAHFQDIVRGGIRQSQGMANFSNVVTKEEADMILQYVNARSNEDWGNF
jgi:quinohemoprotein ethanol dehydrogenase